MKNDAYVIVRKYHDATVSIAYIGHYPKTHFSIEQFIVESIEG